MVFIPIGIIGTILIVVGFSILKQRTPAIISIGMILIGLVLLGWAIIVGYDTISNTF